MAFSVASLGRQQYIQDTTSPQIRPAGLVTRIEETAAQALSWSARPPTPPEQRKYRGLTAHEPGAIVRHFGTFDDPIPSNPPGEGFGVSTKSRPGENVASQIKGSFPETEAGRWKLEESENIYASSKTEPLGKGFKRGTKIPEGLGTTRPFGHVIDALGKDRARQAKHVVFPTDHPPVYDEEGSKTHELYVRSHKDFLPGEQRRRDYDWASTQVPDPTTHSFGMKDKDNYRDGVRKALQPGLDQEQPPPRVVTSKLHEDHKLSTVDQLGTVKKLGTGERNLGPDHVFGMPSLKHGLIEEGVEGLMKLGLTQELQQPDADLGKSLKEGWRNIAPDGRVFGAPSIRLDLPVPKKPSVTNTKNYGNEPDALQLLRPPKSVERGVHEAHYIQLRPKDEIRAIVDEADINLSDEQFDAIYAMAVNADGEDQQPQQTGAGPRCCLDTFFKARHYVLSRTMDFPRP